MIKNLLTSVFFTAMNFIAPKKPTPKQQTNTKLSFEETQQKLIEYQRTVIKLANEKFFKENIANHGWTIDEFATHEYLLANVDTKPKYLN